MIDNKKLKELLMRHINKKLTVNLVNKLQEEIVGFINNKKEIKRNRPTAFVSMPGVKGTTVQEVKGQPYGSPPPGVDVISHPRADDAE
jgi:hypothetical protein